MLVKAVIDPVQMFGKGNLDLPLDGTISKEYVTSFNQSQEQWITE